MPSKEKSEQLSLFHIATNANRNGRGARSWRRFTSPTSLQRGNPLHYMGTRQFRLINVILWH